MDVCILGLSGLAMLVLNCSYDNNLHKIIAKASVGLNLQNLMHLS